MTLKLPRRRQKGLVVHTLPDETLVYDLEQDRALVLNATAALVFSLCDGQTPPARMGEVLAQTLAVANAGPLVELALAELAKGRLLDTPAPKRRAPALVSRRQLLSKLGVSAAALPTVFALLAPTAASAASYIAAPVCNTTTGRPPTCPGQKCAPTGLPQKYCRTGVPTWPAARRRTCSCR